MTATKICIKCDEEKPLARFSFRDKKRGVRHNRCKACHAAYRKKHYHENREMYKRKARKWNAIYKESRRAEILNYVLDYLLDNPCVDCGETNPIVLQFDHVRGEKRIAVSRMFDGSYKLDTVKEEIAKCDVRCANCHQLKTAIEAEWEILTLLNERGIEYNSTTSK